jgi:hypothetical protein
MPTARLHLCFAGLLLALVLASALPAADSPALFAQAPGAVAPIYLPHVERRAAGSHLVRVAQMGGSPVSSLVVSGTVAVAAVGASVRVIDLADPAAPVDIDRVQLGHLAQDIGLAADHVVVTGGSAGLTVLEGPLAALRITAWFPAGDSAGTVYVAAGYAYVADGKAGLRVLDLSVPGAPRWAGVFATPGECRDVAVDGDVAVVADSASGYFVLDVSDPLAPRQLASIEPPAACCADHVALSGSLAVVSESGKLARFFDLRDPEHPAEVARYSVTPKVPKEIALSAGDLYFVMGNLGVWVLKVGLDGSAYQEEIIQTDSATDVAVASGRIYIADGSQIRIVDTGSGPYVHETARLDLGATVNGVAAAGGYAFAAVEGGLRVLDISSLTAPKPIVEYPLESITDLAATGRRVYLAELAQRQLGLRILDADHVLTLPSATVITTTASADPPKVFADGSTVYLGSRSLYVVDAADPRQPRLLGAVDVGAQIVGIVVQGGLAYVASAWVGDAKPPQKGTRLTVIDVSEPSHMVVLSRYSSLVMQPRALAVVDGVAMLTLGADGLLAVDVRDPTSPRLMTQLATLDSADVVPYANGAIVVGYGTLDFVDVSNGVSVSSSYPMFDAISYVALLGDAAVGGVDKGVRLVYLAGGATPRVLGAVPVAWRAGPLAVDGRTFAAASDAGARLYEEGADGLSEVAVLPPAATAVAIGDGLLVASDRKHMTYYDVATPAAPVVVGATDLKGEVATLATRGGLVCADHVEGYWAGWSFEWMARLSFIDATEPRSPRMLATFDYMRIDAIEILTTSMLAVSPWDVSMWDITDPTQPKQGPKLSLGPVVPSDGAIVGRFVAATAGDVWILDFNDPASPRVISQTDVPGAATAVAASWPLVYVAAGRDGLHVLDVSDPTHPRLLESHAIVPEALDVAVSAGTVLVSAGDGGLVVFKRR